ncbi:MAG: phosphatidylglycerophosphatase A [Elusimicrobia bacterium]|nr:phosphatidylglycerophosphatase A [Elusimicrobiota bacterium]
MRLTPASLVSTFFLAGRFPVAPGTFTSALALILAFWLHGNTASYFLVTAGVIALGFLFSGEEERDSGRKDPGHIVIDEVAGIFISFFFVPFSWSVAITGFFLFRAFDMFKVPPADRFEKMGGSWGIMADDIMAGIYTNIVLQIALRLVF